ncbi:uncharacterized protein LOC130686141 [Daphnia carinata]|uniref:uncharacterized protein LOC130686141 n=1 Tax=Daphnia carinata TaxID=120202 RepID=UPI0025796C13|nr:uncharacterized protein LOC130686141 [Daphnia carinata]
MAFQGKFVHNPFRLQTEQMLPKSKLKKAFKICVMDSVQLTTARRLTVPWLYSKRHPLAGLWLVALVLITNPLSSSSNPIADESRKSSNDLPFANQKMCSFAESEFKQIDKLFQNIANNDVSNHTSCEIKDVDLPIDSVTDLLEDCSRWTESITRNLNGVINAYVCLRNAPKAISNNRFEELKADYNNKFLQLQRQMENANKKLNEKSKKEFDILAKRYHEIGKKMQEALDALEKERFHHAEVTVTLITVYLGNDNIDSAWDVFNKKSMGMSYKKTTAMMKGILGEAFSANVPITNVIRFIGGLKNNANIMVRGVIVIFNELEKRQTIDRDIVNVLDETIADIIQTCLRLETLDAEKSQLTVDVHRFDQLIVIHNKIEFLKYIYGQ